MGLFLQKTNIIRDYLEDYVLLSFFLHLYHLLLDAAEGRHTLH